MISDEDLAGADDAAEAAEVRAGVEKDKKARSLAAKEKGAKTTTDEDVVRKTRLEHAQCVLAALFGRSPLVENPRTKNKKNLYRNFIMMDSQNPAGMISYIHKVKEASSFFKMPSPLISHMVPEIRLFGVDRNNVKHEYFFDSSDTLANMPGSQKGRTGPGRSISEKKGTDAGILEVQIEDLTSQPAEEGNTLVVKVKLFFKSFGTFTSKAGTASGKPYSDLVTRSINTEKGYDPLDTQAILHVGYKIPKLDPSKIGVSRGKFKEIKKAIQKSKRVLRLHLREHQLSFNEDGSVELEMTYNGAVDGIYRDPRTDLMMTADEQKRINILRKNIEEVKSEARARGSKVDAADQEDIKRYNNLISKATNNLKDEAMSRFMQELFNAGNKYKQTSPQRSYIKVITVPTALLGAIAKGENLQSQDVRKLAADECAVYNKLLGAATVASGNSAVEGKLDAARQLQAVIEEKTKGQSGDDATSKRTKKLEDINGKFSIHYSTSASPEKLEKATKAVEVALGDAHPEFESDKFMDISFFHYGDILEVALNILRKPDGPFHEEYVKGGRMDTFPTPILGPVLLRTESCAGQSNPRSGANIADIPISVDFFIDFMTNKFIKPARGNLLFRDFVHLLNKSVLPGALGETCRLESSGQNVQYAHSMPISIKKHGPDDPCLGYATADGRTGQNYIDESYARMKLNNLSYLSTSVSLVKTKEYNLIYIPNYVFTGLSGDASSDQGKGIHHIIAGTSDTPVKTFSIDTNTQPFMAEALTFPKDGRPKLGGDISGGARYDLTLEMLGHTFFKIGYPFFFNLSSLSLGNTNDAESLSQRLGIGGYYQCNKLNYIITASEFITKIQALFMAAGKLQGTSDATAPAPEQPSGDAPAGGLWDAAVDAVSDVVGI